MPETILVHYQLTRELWRQFFDAHYGCDPSIKLRYFWGVVCILIAALGFGGYYDAPLVAALLMATGFYGVLSKHLLIYRSLQGARRHPFYGRTLDVAVAPDEISVRSGDSGYRQPWGNFVGYRRLAPGFLFYHDRNAFFFLPVAQLSAGHAKRIEQIVRAAEVPDLGAKTRNKNVNRTDDK